MAHHREFLSFGIEQELYAMPLTTVREIIGLPSITRLPSTPAWLRGVINLRSSIIPVVDMRQQFGLPLVPYGKFSVAIVVEAAGAVIGLIVDSVKDVVDLEAAQIESLPANFASLVRADFLTGLALARTQMLLLLDVERMLTDEQVGVLRERNVP